MKRGIGLRSRCGIVLAAVTFACAAGCYAAEGVVSGASQPVDLRCDSLTNPLGIDDPQPVFAWRLGGSAQGLMQTAYRVEVSSDAARLTSGNADVWDSGKIASASSLNVVYGGKALDAGKRYAWRVTVWDGTGKALPVSEAAWWETGLMKQENWRGQWISFLEPEEQAVREANAPWIWNSGEDAMKHAQTGAHAFRLSFDQKKPVAQAVLFVTGKERFSAWVNGQQVLAAAPMPPWKQTPWGTYTRQEVTAEVRQGSNALAVAVEVGGNNDASSSMNATLLVRAADGMVSVYTSGSAWRGMFHAPDGWTAAAFDDAGWPAAVVTAQTGDAEFGRPWPTGAVKMLRRGFFVEKAVVSARLYVTAMGAYEMRLNGSRVGDELLTPGWTDYRERLPYQVYDVTGMIRKGGNAMGAYLAPGWYSTPLMWYRHGNNYGSTPPALMAQLRLEAEDGSVTWIATDGSWRAAVSPMLEAELYDGETYDARREQPGWDTGAFAETQWKPVALVKPAAPRIESQSYQPIREERLMDAKAITSPSAGVYIFDFGQNMAGVPRLQVAGKAGTDVRLRFAEVLNEDGTMYVANLRTAKATDHYILSGRGVERYQPRFTFHGFRYVEMTGLPSRPHLSDLKVVVVHTDAPFAMEFSSGSAMVNQLWSNINWGQRSNFVGVPTDCPQRDERLGWAADAQVFWRTATYDMDLAAFSRKYAADLRGTQAGTAMYGIYAPGVNKENAGFGTGWSDAGVIIPWTAWRQYGDKRMAAENWSAMQKYLESIASQNPDFLWTKGVGIPFGDWLAPQEKTSIELIATAYWAYDVSRMEEMAHALGKEEDAQRYAALFGEIKTAFQKAYVKADGTVDGGAAEDNGMRVDTKGQPSKTPGSQTGYVLALYMQLVPDALRAAAVDKLVEKLEANGGKLGTGFLGTPYLLAVLSDNGRSDVAYRLLLNTEYPSWGYLIEHGATTTWERWNGDQMRGDPSMNSYNHYAYGAVGEWMYRYAAGIDTVAADPGFHTVYLHPHFDSRLGRLSLGYRSVYGEIKSAWSVEGKGGTWTVTLPANTEGRLPLEPDRYRLVSVDGVPLAESGRLKRLSQGGDLPVYQLGPGTYAFHFEGSGAAGGTVSGGK